MHSTNLYRIIIDIIFICANVRYIELNFFGYTAIWINKLSLVTVNYLAKRPVMVPECWRMTELGVSNIIYLLFFEIKLHDMSGGWYHDGRSYFCFKNLQWGVYPWITHMVSWPRTYVFTGKSRVRSVYEENENVSSRLSAEKVLQVRVAIT